MAIIQITTDVVGQINVNPRRVKIISSDDLAAVTAAGYLNSGNLMGEAIYPTDIIDMWYDYVSNSDVGTYAVFTPDISASLITLNEWENPGDVLLPVVSGNIPKFNGTSGQIEDAAIAASSLIVNSNNAGQTISGTTASATPGTLRSLVGKMTGSNATITSGNLVGTRGEVDMVGASGGFFYGAQGKVIPTGTLSGSSWTAGVFGQFDISAATINAGQTAALWGDYGATSGTISNASGMRGVSMTNTTAAVLNAQDYRYGNATYLLELAGAGGTLNYYAAAGTSAGSAGDAAHCAAQQVLKIEINGVAAYIPVFTQNT